MSRFLSRKSSNVEHHYEIDDEDPFIENPMGLCEIELHQRPIEPKPLSEEGKHLSYASAPLVAPKQNVYLPVDDLPDGWSWAKTLEGAVYYVHVASGVSQFSVPGREDVDRALQEAQMKAEIQKIESEVVNKAKGHKTATTSDMKIQMRAMESANHSQGIQPTPITNTATTATTATTTISMSTTQRARPKAFTLLQKDTNKPVDTFFTPLIVEDDGEEDHGELQPNPPPPPPPPSPPPLTPTDNIRSNKKPIQFEIGTRNSVLTSSNNNHDNKNNTTLNQSPSFLSDSSFSRSESGFNLQSSGPPLSRGPVIPLSVLSAKGHTNTTPTTTDPPKRPKFGNLFGSKTRDSSSSLISSSPASSSSSHYISPVPSSIAIPSTCNATPAYTSFNAYNALSPPTTSGLKPIPLAQLSRQRVAPLVEEEDDDVPPPPPPLPPPPP